MNDLLRIAIEASVQSAALALCVGAILAAARIHSGAVRHAAWLAVLCGMMLMPLLPRITPRVEVPITLPAVAGAIVNIDEPLAGPPVLAAPGLVVAVRRPASPQKHVAPPRSSQPVSNRVPVSSPIPWSAIVLAVYAAGLLFLLGCLVPGWLAASRIVGESVPVMIGRASVSESPLVNTPLTVGLFSPRIILPLSWRDWTDTKLQAVLAHESAHVKNRDGLVNLAAYLNRCIFWFHPLAWWLERKLATTAEHASDEAGARAVGDSKEYARVLLDVAAVIGSRRRRYAFVSAGMRGDGGLEERIDRILRGDGVGIVSRSRKATVAFVCAILLVAIPACRQGTVVKAANVTLMPEVLALIESRGLPMDPEFRRQLQEVRIKLGQSNNVDVLLTNGQALVKRFEPNYSFGGEGNEAGRFAIDRALTLDPGSLAAREAQVSTETSLLVSGLLRVHRAPEDPEFRKRLAYVAGAMTQSTDVSFLNATASPLVAIDWPQSWPNAQGMGAVAEVFDVGKAGVERALKLNPHSVWARQLMVKVRDHELAASLPENVWNGTLEGRHRGIQALPANERFRELSILAAAAGDDAMAAITVLHNPISGNLLWQRAGEYANEALGMAPQAKDDPDYGTSLFRANMVAAAYALMASDKATALEFARQAMDAPPTEALRYPIVNARPWSNWHYPQMFLAQLLRQGDRAAAADIGERYSHLVIADKDRWVGDIASIRKGGTPDWAQWPWY